MLPPKAETRAADSALEHEADQAAEQVMGEVRPAPPKNNARSIAAPSDRYAHAPRVPQAKLTVGAPGDRYEQEADRVAAQVMQGSAASGDAPASVTAPSPPKLQRMCAGCEQEDEKIRRTPAAAGLTPPASTTAGIESMRPDGAPLPAATRAFFEPRFGFEFGGVRVHNDAHARATAMQLGAQAFTVGQDIYFAPGRFAPETTSGRQLLAHELTHVVQQSGAPPTIQRKGEGQVLLPITQIDEIWMGKVFEQSRILHAELTDERVLHAADQATSTLIGSGNFANWTAAGGRQRITFESTPPPDTYKEIDVPGGSYRLPAWSEANDPYQEHEPPRSYPTLPGGLPATPANLDAAIANQGNALENNTLPIRAEVNRVQQLARVLASPGGINGAAYKTLGGAGLAYTTSMGTISTTVQWGLGAMLSTSDAKLAAMWEEHGKREVNLIKLVNGEYQDIYDKTAAKYDAYQSALTNFENERAKLNQMGPSENVAAQLDRVRAAKTAMTDAAYAYLKECDQLGVANKADDLKDTVEGTSRDVVVDIATTPLILLGGGPAAHIAEKEVGDIAGKKIANLAEKELGSTVEKQGVNIADKEALQNAEKRATERPPSEAGGATDAPKVADTGDTSGATNAPKVADVDAARASGEVADELGTKGGKAHLDCEGMLCVIGSPCDDLEAKYPDVLAKDKGLKQEVDNLKIKAAAAAAAKKEAAGDAAKEASATLLADAVKAEAEALDKELKSAAQTLASAAKPPPLEPATPTAPAPKEKAASAPEEAAGGPQAYRPGYEGKTGIQGELSDRGADTSKLQPVVEASGGLSTHMVRWKKWWSTLKRPRWLTVDATSVSLNVQGDDVAIVMIRNEGGSGMSAWQMMADACAAVDVPHPRILRGTRIVDPTIQARLQAYAPGTHLSPEEVRKVARGASVIASAMGGKVAGAVVVDMPGGRSIALELEY